jgi:myo-inositol-1(or 4)-monophosphatase
MNGLSNPSPELQTAIQVARQAGAMLRAMLGKVRIHHKGLTDLVTEADQRSEAMIFDHLKAAFPDYGYTGEEGAQADGAGKLHWYVDPLDGTTNYAHSYPFFCVSIGLVKEAEMQLGVVYNPVLDELFYAEIGQGAFLNDRRLQVSGTATLDQALVASGFPYDVWDSKRSNLTQWAAITRRVRSIRCDGSAALDLCHVAAGRLDAYWELHLQTYDMAAGALILREAGGRISKIDGGDFDIHGQQILASNAKLHQEMVDAIKRVPEKVA